jgi:hypothetical protein
LLEQFQINRFGHSAIARIIRVHMISRIVGWAKPSRMLWIPDHGFEVDYAIERMTGPDPLVYRLSGRFCLNGIFGRALSWQKGRSKDLQVDFRNTMHQLVLAPLKHNRE